MSNLAVDYGQASTVSRNISSALNYLAEEISKINSSISEIESLNRGYGKTSTILNELYDQQKKAQTAYDEMQQFSEKFSGFISNVKTTDSEMAKKFTADVKTYCKKNNIEITSELDAFLDKIQVVLDVVGFIPVFGEVADALNAVISLCRGNYLEALICLVAILPMGDLLKGLKFADKAKDLLKYGDEVLAATKTVAKEGAEKLSKQMTKIVKSGKLDNVIATMDAGKDFAVRFKNGSTALIKKGDLSEFVCQAFNKGCFMAGTLVATKDGLKNIEEVKIGDYVLSRNEENGQTSYKKVTDTLVRSTYNICTINLENGKIMSTTGHLFMVKDKWWQAAAELKPGDILQTADGTCQVVQSITIEEKSYPVITYNLTIEENHTFFVNNECVLTHNTTGFKSCELAGSVAKDISNNELSRIDYLRNKYGKLSFNDINNRINLRTSVKEELDKVIRSVNDEIEKKISALSKNQIRKGAGNRIRNEEYAKVGPALAGVMDTKTGKIYISTNQNNIPELVNPQLYNKICNIPDKVRDYYKNITPGTNPGAHAEVYALNEALNARSDAKIGDMICCVVETGMGKNKSQRVGMYMARCPHCEYITDGVKYFPETLWYGKANGRVYGDYGG